MTGEASGTLATTCCVVGGGPAGMMLGLLLATLEKLGELDNTFVIVSGDHGAPGFPHGKCNLYDFGVSVPLAIRWSGAQGGRVVDDLASLTDVAPTLLEVAGLKPAPNMTGRSLVNVLKTDKSGLVDPQRTAVFFGRERLVHSLAGHLVELEGQVGHADGDLVAGVERLLVHAPPVHLYPIGGAEVDDLPTALVAAQLGMPA